MDKDSKLITEAYSKVTSKLTEERMPKSILSVVWKKADRDLSHFDHDQKKWIEKGPPIPRNEYIGSGGHMTTDLQKAQIFGFSRAAQKKLDVYRNDPEIYEVRPIHIEISNFEDRL